MPCFGNLWEGKVFSSLGLKGKWLTFLSFIWANLGKYIEKRTEDLVFRQDAAKEYVKLKMREYQGASTKKELPRFPLLDPGPNALYTKDFRTTEERYKQGRINKDAPKPLAPIMGTPNEDYSQFLIHQLTSPRAKRYANGRRAFVLTEFEPTDEGIHHEKYAEPSGAVEARGPAGKRKEPEKETGTGGETTEATAKN